MSSAWSLEQFFLQQYTQRTGVEKHYAGVKEVTGVSGRETKYAPSTLAHTYTHTHSTSWFCSQDFPSGVWPKVIISVCLNRLSLSQSPVSFSYLSFPIYFLLCLSLCFSVLSSSVHLICLFLSSCFICTSLSYFCLFSATLFFFLLFSLPSVYFCLFCLPLHCFLLCH